METRRLLSANIPAPTPIVTSSPPSSTDATTLAMDASGNIWFTDPSNDAIGKQTPSGTVSEYNLPTDEAWPDAIAAGPNGNFWFVEDDADQIGRITPTGGISEFALPSDNSSPTAIVSGPSGDMWFVDEGTNEIGKITPTGKVTEYPIASSLLSEHPSVKPLAIHASTNKAFGGNIAILKGITATDANLAQLRGSINWGDGSTPSAAQFMSGPKGEILVRASHNFATGGKRSITVSLTQNIGKGTSSTSDPPIALPAVQISAHVTGKAASAKYHAKAIPISAVVGVPFQGTVGTLTGPVVAAGQSLVATISWGDGSQSTGSISDDDSGGWQIAGSHTFEKKGRRHIQVVVRLQTSGSAQSHPVARFGTTAVISAS